MEPLQVILLFENIKQNDKNAFDKLFCEYYEKLTWLAFQYLKQSEDAEDVVSEFFVNLWQRRSSLPEINSPVSYLYKSVKNACLNYKRRPAKSNTGNYEVQDDKVKTIPAETKELSHLLNNTINELPEQRRIIFKLIKENGLKSKEVAEILNLSERTVENQLYKALKTLSDSISRYLGYNPQKPIKRGDAGLLLFIS